MPDPPPPPPTSSDAARLWELDCGATHRAGVWLFIVAYGMALVDVGPHPLFCAIVVAWTILVVLPASWFAARGQTKAAVDYILERPVSFVHSYRRTWWEFMRGRSYELRRALNQDYFQAFLVVVLIPAMAAVIYTDGNPSPVPAGALSLLLFALLGVGAIHLTYAHVWRTEGRQRLEAVGLDVKAVLLGEGYGWRWWWGWLRPDDPDVDA